MTHFQYEIKHVSCNLCGIDEVYILFSGTSLDRRQYNHVRCKKCGLIYADPMPVLTPKALETIAMELWNNDFLKNKESFDWDKLQRSRKHNSLRIKELQKYKKEGRLLEIGCGNGFFLAEASKNGWQVYGVETCGELVEYINKYLDLNIFAGILEEAKFPDKFFDVVYLNHLLEHLIDPAVFLTEVNRIIKDGGLIFIGIPNANDLFNGLNKILAGLRLKPNWTGYLYPPMHLYAFTPHTLTKLLKKTGFRILNLFTIVEGNSIYFPDYSKWNLKKALKRLVAFPGQFLGMGAHIEAYAVKS